MRHLDLEADLRFDGPAGPGRITADDGGIVVRVSGWGRLLRLAYRLWRRPPPGLPPSPRALARTVARLTRRPVYVHGGLGPRIRVADAPGPGPTPEAGSRRPA